MTVKLTGNFLATARCLIYEDGNSIAWSFNSNTNELTAAYTGAGSAGSHNPTASIGLTAVNGTATTWMTSDSAPALSVAIVPTWTGAHTFSNNVTLNGELIDGLGSAGTSTYVLSSTGTGVKWVAASSGGSGTVTSVTVSSSGSTINVTGTNPITTSGTVNVDVNSVSYDSFILGLPAAATLTGSEVVAIEQSGAAVQTTVSGIAQAVKYNITADSHSAVPTGIGVGPNDEFETGSSIDTTGARYSSATGWTAFNTANTSNSVSQGSLVLSNTSSTALLNGYSQPVSGSTWAYTAKVSLQGATGASTISGGMFTNASGASTGKSLIFVMTTSASAVVAVQRLTNSTTLSASEYLFAGTALNVGGSLPPFYLQISYDGTNINFSISATGVQFTKVYSEAPASFLGATPTVVGLTLGANANTSIVVDWFRKTA